MQRRKGASAELAAVPPIVHVVLRTPGQPVDSSVRTLMEPRFQRDFSQVRVHKDSRAAASAGAVGALAYTVGRDVVFGDGQYAPENTKGQKLLAHELAHVVQKGGSDSGSPSMLTVGSNETAHEREADKIAEEIMAGAGRLGNLTIVQAPLLQRHCSGERWTYEHDGCSVPDFVTAGLGIADRNNPTGASDTHFAFGRATSAGGVACDRHDECYQTCNPLPGAKAACDIRMYTDMLQICASSRQSPAVKEQCRSWALTYYLGLVAAGDFAFTQRQAQVCGCRLRGLF